MSIAIRRHHATRLKKVRKLYWHWNDKTPRQLGILVNTPTVCSCWMCGNDRKYLNEKTVQERRNEQRDTWED